MVILSTRILRTSALALACAVLAGCSAVLLPPNVTPVAPLSHSVEQADHALAEAAKNRAAIEAAYAASEQVCAVRFFVNSCLDDAREKRRGALAVVRAVEIEAEYFKRKYSADERDRALAQATSDDALRAAARAADAEAQAAAAAARAATPLPAPPAIKPGFVPGQRALQHAARIKRLAEKESAEAPQRAAKAAAFEQRKLKSAQRQRDVAEKKAAAEAAAQPPR
jgi:colicin import membrane protein